MIDNACHELSIREQCKLLDISKSSIYYKQSSSEEKDSVLANAIHELWLKMPFYGYRRITADLQRNGYDINHKRVLRLMQEMHLQAMYPRPRTTIFCPENKVYPYLLRGLKIEYPNQVWATDITYIKTAVGFMYLIGFIDLHSRFILAWSLSNTLDTLFCVETFHDALTFGIPEILNTDQGSQFTNHFWLETVESYGILPSMDGVGRWADNIFIERFWRTLKHEHILLHVYDNINDLKASIDAYIQLYNYERLHQNLGYKTPAEVYWRYT
ncbi:MAG: IS3 family transposase [Candidatus Acidiferrales bacterium]